MFNITGHNGDHIPKPSFYQYMLFSNWEYVVFAQNGILERGLIQSYLETKLELHLWEC